MYVDDRHTISAVSLHGEDATGSLPAAWTSIDNPRGIGISPDGGRGVRYDSGDQDTTLILESGEWKRNTIFRLINPSGYIYATTITTSGEVITADVSIRFDFIECFMTTFLRAHSWLNWVECKYYNML